MPTLPSSFRASAIAMGVVVLLASCSDDTEPAETASPTTATTETSVSSTTSDVPSESSDTVENDPGLAPLVDMAIADLAAELDTDPDSIVLVKAVLVEWPNQGLGCDDDRSHPPGVIDGSEIVLEAAGRQYSYRTGGNQFTPVRCP